MTRETYTRLGMVPPEELVYTMSSQAYGSVLLADGMHSIRLYLSGRLAVIERLRFLTQSTPSSIEQRATLRLAVQSFLADIRYLERIGRLKEISKGWEFRGFGMRAWVKHLRSIRIRA